MYFSYLTIQSQLSQLCSMCDKIKVFKLHSNTMESILYLITVLTKVIAIVFVFENFIVFVITMQCIWTQVSIALCVHEYS